MAKIVVCGLGGTIAMTAEPGSGAVPALTAANLLAAVPGAGALGLEIEVVDVAQLPSASLRLEDVVALSRTIAARLADGADGVVVTQGTDTLEESAYLLDLLHERPEPVVVTGAMRGAAVAGADGPANLLAALTVAAEPGARDRGVLVAFADEVHAAARVRKGHATSVSAFVSPTGGPLGHVAEGGVRFFNTAGRRVVVPRPVRGVLPRVPVIFGALWAPEPELGGEMDGLVVAAFGAGHLPQWWVEPLGALAARIPVVLASRTMAGQVLADTYGFPGSERDLLGQGLIPAGSLDPFKARILLLAVLAAGGGREQVANALRTIGSA